MKTTKWLATGALVAGLALPGTAIAQSVMSTADVNMRAGPGTRYPVVTTIPQDRNVDVYGCDQDLDWCEVAWRGNRGWVFSDYLEVTGEARMGRMRSGPLAELGAMFGLPTVGYDQQAYWDRYYADQPWYDTGPNWSRRVPRGFEGPNFGRSEPAPPFHGDRGWGRVAD